MWSLPVRTTIRALWSRHGIFPKPEAEIICDLHSSGLLQKLPTQLAGIRMWWNNTKKRLDMTATSNGYRGKVLHGMIPEASARRKKGGS